MRNGDLRAFATFGAILTGTGFVLHFLWEYFQCSPFFRHLSVQPKLSAMILVTVGDLAILWAAYLAAALIMRSAFWYKDDLSIASLFWFIIPAILIVAVIELEAIQTGRWSYTDANPTLPRLGISILPIFQMALVNPATLYFTKLVLNSLANAKPNPKEQL